jgi:hypothetical protein
VKCGNSTLPMSPVATEIEIAWGGACPPHDRLNQTGNYTTSADANPSAEMKQGVGGVGVQ